MPVKIKICFCKHDYQDKKYGKQQRVHNSMGANSIRYRCTVCKDEKS